MPCKLFSEDCIAGFTKFSHHHPSGRIYRPEGVDSWILNLTVDGGGIINPSSATPFEVGAGDLLLFPPVIVHDYCPKPGGDWLHDWIVFQETEHLHNLLFYGPEEHGGVGRIRLSPDLYREIGALTRKAQQLVSRIVPYKLRRRLILNVVEEILLLSLPEREKTPSEHNAHGIFRIEESLNYIHAHYAEPVSIPDLAEHACFSVSRYSHLFRQIKGIAPGQYILQYRIGKARELLISTNTSISEIAAQCGFDDVFYFSNLFRRLTGISPRNYRKGVRSLAPVFDSAFSSPRNENTSGQLKQE